MSSLLGVGIVPGWGTSRGPESFFAIGAGGSGGSGDSTGVPRAFDVVGWALGFLVREMTFVAVVP